MKINRWGHGQSLLEFALVIPIFILAVSVFMDLGRAVYSYSALSSAVREGTRFAIVHSLESNADKDIVIQVVKDAAVGLNPANITVVLTPPAAPSHYVTIHASYVFSPVTPGLSLILGTGNNITLQTESSMEVAPLYQDY